MSIVLYISKFHEYSLCDIKSFQQDSFFCLFVFSSQFSQICQWTYTVLLSSQQPDPANSVLLQEVVPVIPAGTTNTRIYRTRACKKSNELSSVQKHLFCYSNQFCSSETWFFRLLLSESYRLLNQNRLIQCMKYLFWCKKLLV